MRFKKHVTKKVLVVKSGLEKAIAEQLDDERIKYGYETIKLPWDDRNPRAECAECGAKSVFQKRVYIPDFILPDGSIIEGKGRLTSDDRKLLKGVRARNPDTVIRIIFARDNRLSKKSKTRYSDWATQFGFEYTIGARIPPGWLKLWKR
jgi:hypothetical protein